MRYNTEKLKAFENEFKKNFPSAWYRIGDFYSDGEDVFWSGEDCFAKDNRPMFDYYYYDTGVHPEVEKLTEKYGFYFEAYDAGTFVLYEL